MDAFVLHRLYGLGGAWLWLMATLTVVGSGWTMVPIAGAAAHPKMRTHALRLVGLLAVVAVAVFSLKALVGRARPCWTLADVHALVFAAPRDPSFPSGHAAGAFAVAAYVALETRVHPGIKLGLFIVAAGIAISRVVLGVHYPTDIVAGALLGTTMAFAMRVFFTARATASRTGRGSRSLSRRTDSSG